MNMILFTIVILGFSTGIVQAGEVAGKVEFVSGDAIEAHWKIISV